MTTLRRLHELSNVHPRRPVRTPIAGYVSYRSRHLAEPSISPTAHSPAPLRSIPPRTIPATNNGTEGVFGVLWGGVDSARGKFLRGFGGGGSGRAGRGDGPPAEALLRPLWHPIHR